MICSSVLPRYRIPTLAWTRSLACRLGLAERVEDESDEAELTSPTVSQRLLANALPTLRRSHYDGLAFFSIADHLMMQERCL